jgi:hypothetical protein
MSGSLLLIVHSFIRGQEATGVPESRFVIDLYDHEGRKKLARHSWWAAHNGRSVLTFAKPGQIVEDVDMPTESP